VKCHNNCAHNPSANSSMADLGMADRVRTCISNVFTIQIDQRSASQQHQVNAGLPQQ
jgi:hypothetical protein